MVIKKRKIIWDREAVSYFKKSIAYIKKDSPQNADKVKKAILSSVSELTIEAEKRYAPDKFRLNNNGNYRAFEIYHFRIAYFIDIDYIRIVRFRHTNMEPKEY